HLEILRQHVGDAVHASGPGTRGEVGLVERLRAGIHDRSDGEGSRPGGERGARAARSRRGRAGGAAGPETGVVARLRPTRLHERVRIPQALGGRSTRLIAGPRVSFETVTAHPRVTRFGGAPPRPPPPPP